MSEQDLMVRISSDISDFQRDMQRVSTQINQMQSEMRRMGESTQRGMNGLGTATGGATRGMGLLRGGIGEVMGAFGGLGAAAAVIGVIAHQTSEAVRVYADFEQAVKNTQVIAGGTAKDFGKLADAAKKMGAESTLSSTEVANAMTELAKKGMNVNQVIGAMPGIISAAESSGEDLATVSDIAASALNAFGMKAKDTSKLADILAATSNKTAAGVQDVGYALKYAAPFAKALGMDVGDLATMTGLLINKGASAEQVGTSLRMAMSRLVDPTKEGANAFKEMGIKLQDSAGKMKPVTGIFQELHDKMKGMSGDQQLKTVSDIFGVEAAPQVLNLIKTMGGEYQKLNKTIEGSAGAAKKNAEAMKDTFKGSVEKMKGEWESFQITLGKTAAVPAQAAVKGAEGVLSRLNKALKEIHDAQEQNSKPDTDYLGNKRKATVEIDAKWGKYKDFDALINFSEAKVGELARTWSVLTEKEMKSFEKHLETGSSMWGEILGKAWTLDNNGEFANYLNGKKEAITQHNQWELSTMTGFYDERNGLIKQAFATATRIDQDEAALALSNLDAQNQARIDKMNNLNREQAEIMANFSNQTVNQQRESAERLVEIENEKQQMLMDAASLTQTKRLQMLEYQKNEEGRISSETAQKAIDEANREFEGVVNKANETAAGQIAAVKQAAASGEISKTTADKLIGEIERTRVNTISKADAMKKGYVNKVQEMQDKSKEKMPAITIPKVTGIGWLDSAIDKLSTFLHLRGQAGSGGGGGGSSHSSGGGKPRHAAGGIVTAPQTALIGEAGAEAIIPLSNKHRIKPFANAVADAMGAPGGGGGGVVITGNTFHVREEADVEKVARQLNELQTREDRARGVVRY